MGLYDPVHKELKISVNDFDEIIKFMLIIYMDKIYRAKSYDPL